MGPGDKTIQFFQDLVRRQAEAFMHLDNVAARVINIIPTSPLHTWASYCSFLLLRVSRRPDSLDQLQVENGQMSKSDKSTLEYL